MWLSKENILYKNLKKIQPPDELTFNEKTIKFLLLFAFDITLSWLNVLVLLWLTLQLFLKVVREIFTSTPEDIKSLRFPLYNNHDMSREAVWAYTTALGLKAGANQSNNEDELFNTLNEVRSYYPFFSRTSTVNELNSLKILSPDIINKLLTRLSSTVDDDGDIFEY